MEYQVPKLCEIKKLAAQNLFSVVSFFAGGGGSSTGYKMAGGNILCVNEFIPDAVETYLANYPKTKMLSKDIRKTSVADVLNATGLSPGRLDILDGSPPCAPFSTSGQREKSWGKNKKYSSTKQHNTEDLFFDFIRFIDGLLPKVFIAENVPGLCYKGAAVYFQKIIKKMQSAGYFVEARIVDAKWLGVPQSRKRLFFIGIRNDIHENTKVQNIFPKPKGQAIPLSEAFRGVINTAKDLAETDITKYKTYRHLQRLAPGRKDKKYFNLGKASPFKPSPTITATSGTISAASVRHWNNRAFTIPELKRITSLPDDYILTGPYSKKAERIGRMVPPLVIMELAKHIHRNVLNGHT